MEIAKAKVLPDYRLELQFDNGEGGVVDLSDFVGRGVFAAISPDAAARIAGVER